MGYINKYKWLIISIIVLILVLMNLIFNSNYYLNKIRKKSGSFQITSDWEKYKSVIGNFTYNFVGYQKRENPNIKKVVRRENVVITNRNDIEFEFIDYKKFLDDRLLVVELSAEYIWKNIFWCYEIDTAYFYKTISYVDMERKYDTIHLNIDALISEEEYRQLLEFGEIEVD
ncbi:hypothetical protein LJB85_04040 [Porphyromonadaceae bacterium OttesenSCG-928-L07]|nr:hypothetical protein [Porphyromonadaceae bacterium OttesenSCG-928-L07]MDL2330949.1 hypothetical protein [Odoribacter sp. OttesenSCG-928-A06]